MKNLLLCIILGVLFTEVANAESLPADTSIITDNPQPNAGRDLLRVADATLYTWSGPGRWKGKDWAVFGGVLAGSLLVTLADEPVREFWQHRDSGFWDGVERVGFHNGKPYAALAFTGGFYLTGLIFKNEWARETGLVLAGTYLTTGALQTLLKSVAGRARPGTEAGNWAYRPFSSDAAYHSFPSGHIQIAFATAMVLARRVNHPALKVLFYGLAASTLASRMYSDAHWISDMTFGGAFAWFFADSVTKRMEDTKRAVDWKLGAGPQGITLTGTF